MFKALVKAGAVSEDNAVDHRKIDFQRAARTDAGVHAAGNVYVQTNIGLHCADHQYLAEDDCGSTITCRTSKSCKLCQFLPARANQDVGLG